VRNERRMLCASRKGRCGQQESVLLWRKPGAVCLDGRMAGNRDSEAHRQSVYMGSEMRAHVIANGRVVNTIEVASLDFMEGLIDATLGGEVGNLGDGRSFTKSPK
jgi:hypothetical protein